MLIEKTFTTGEFTMNYGEGPQNGAPLVLLHGATLWWRDFEPIIPSLMQSWQVYACDMRGHGKSSHTPGKYRALDFASDVIQFIQTQIQEPVVIIGHSGGGIYTLIVAGQIPKMVQASILLDPATIARNTPIQSIRGPGDWVIGIGDVFESRRAMKDFLLESNPDIDELGLQITESMIRSIDPDFISTLIKNRFCDDLNLEQELTKITCPALMLYGTLELGSIVPESEVEFLKQHIPQITAVRISGAGHSPHWEQTQATIGYIYDFLKRT
jgi:pimeloyl-ACP methyl ester carboxylesterase